MQKKTVIKRLGAAFILGTAAAVLTVVVKDSASTSGIPFSISVMLYQLLYFNLLGLLLASSVLPLPWWLNGPVMGFIFAFYKNISVTFMSYIAFVKTWKFFSEDALIGMAFGFFFELICLKVLNLNNSEKQ